MNLGKFGEIWGRNFGKSHNLGKSPKFQKKRGISRTRLYLVLPCTTIYRCLYSYVPPCTTIYHHIGVAYNIMQVQGSTYWYKQVSTIIGITYVSTYWYVPFWGFSYLLVSTSVRTCAYWYIPPCTAILVYTILYCRNLPVRLWSPTMISFNFKFTGFRLLVFRLQRDLKLGHQIIMISFPDGKPEEIIKDSLMIRVIGMMTVAKS